MKYEKTVEVPNNAPLFSKRLAEVLKEKRLSQKDLAELSGVTTSSLSPWLKGTTEPKIYGVAQIAKALNISIDYLLGLSDVKTPDIKMQAISRGTGLSDKAIKKLKRLKRDNGLNMMMDALNSFIESDFFEPLLFELVEYATANPDKSFTYGVHNLKLRDIAEYKIQQALSTIIKDVEQDFTDNPKSAKEKLYYNLLYAARQNGSISDEEFKIHKREFDSGNFSFAEK